MLDEVEKAHPDVFNILLQVLDDGRLTDNKGRVVNFKNTIIIMTSNMGSGLIRENFAGITPLNHTEIVEKTKKQVLDMLKVNIRPEFLNRIDEIIMFEPLNMKEIKQVVRIQLDGIVKMLKSNGVKLEFTDDAVTWIAQTGFDPEFGARPVKRAIQHLVLDPLSKKLLEGSVNKSGPIVVDVIDGVLFFKN